MVKGIRKLEKSLGTKKRIYKKEKQIRRWATRSIVSLRDIHKNQKISADDIWSKDLGQEFLQDL